VTASKGGISAMALQRQMGFGSYGTAWAWRHKIRRAMVRPEREPLAVRVEADATIDGNAVDPVPQGMASPRRGHRVGGAQPGKPGRGADGKTVVAGAIEAAPGKGRKRRLGRLRLQAVPDASARSLEGFLAANVATPAAVGTDGWQGYAGLGAAGYAHAPIKLAAGPRGSADPRRFANGSTEGRWGDAVPRPPAIHLVSGLAKRWLPVSCADIPPGDRATPDGTHHGAVGKKHLRAHLDAYVFRFHRRTAKCISHRFARLIEQAVLTSPTTYHAISHGSPA
jgi:hypothetical protein